MDTQLRGLIAQGKEHYQAHEYDKAEKTLSEVLAQHRGFPDVFHMLGVIYHEQGRLDVAKESFEEALKLNPNYTEAALNLAVTYNDLGLYAQAREVYMRAMAQTGTQPHAIDPFALGKIANMHAELAATYAGLALYAQSVREYRHALELCPQFVDLRTKLAQVYRDMGDTQAALGELLAVKKSHPQYVPARIALGLVLHALRRTAEAEKEWQSALEIAPENKTAKLFLRMVQDDKPKNPL